MNPLLLRFLRVFSNNVVAEGEEAGELTFRSFMYCLRLFKNNISAKEKLRFWYNVMKCTHDEVEDATSVTECLSEGADGEMVVAFLADAVCSAVKGISSIHKSRTVRIACYSYPPAPSLPFPGSSNLGVGYQMADYV